MKLLIIFFTFTIPMAAFGQQPDDLQFCQQELAKSQAQAASFQLVYEQLIQLIKDLFTIGQTP